MISLASATERATALARALWTLLRLVHAQWAPAHLESVQCLNRGLRLVRRHVDEREPARFAGLPIVDQLYRIHLAMALEQRLDVLLGGTEGQIAHIDRRHPKVSLGNADSGEPHESVA